jgi:putative flavoprotein involved in K+ transport
MDKSLAVVVVGGGVSALATGAELISRGVQAVVLDASAGPGDSWRQRYDSLKLNSVRWFSGFRGYPIPRASGRYVKRDDFAAYIRDFAEQAGVALEQARVERVDRQGEDWVTTTGDARYVSRHVVIATGLKAVPALPDWFNPAAYAMTVLHSSAYRSARDFEGQRVLVVGAGNSGAEIATDLVRERRTGSVTVAIRTPPNIMPRDLWGLPLQNFAVVNRYLPLTMQDQSGRVVQRVTLGDLSKTPIGLSPLGMFSRVSEDGVSPTVDDGFVGFVRKGRITIVDAVTGLEPAGARTASGRLVEADAVIAATGYRADLDGMLGHLGVLGQDGLPPQYGSAAKAWRAQGLHFVGFASPLSGHLRECVILARRAARAIERSEGARARGGPGRPPVTAARAAAGGAHV